MKDAWVVFCTAPSREEALRLARAVVESKEAACVNIVGPITSIYRWQGEVVQDQEYLMVLKTTPGRFQALKKTLEQFHSYTVPEILALPVAEGAEKYLAWLREETEEETP